MEFYIRKAESADAAIIMDILEQAREYLRQQGSPQWQGGQGPSEANLARDIRREEGYVLLRQGTVCGYAAIAAEAEAGYETLDGQWLPGYDCYAAIHRVAISPAFRGKGLAKQFLRDLVIIARVLGHQDIRIDTHPMNAIMQKAVLHAGFAYRGMVQLPIPNGERMAYQQLLP